MKMYFVKYHGADWTYPVYSYMMRGEKRITIAVHENEILNTAEEVLFFDAKEAGELLLEYNALLKDDEIGLSIDCIEVDVP